jgi:hypothetical protein
MTARTSKQSWITTFAKRVVLFLTVTVSSLALAQAVPTIGASGGQQSKVPYRGTSVSYGASTSVYNYSPSTVAITHRLGLMPEWHFGDVLTVRSRFFLTQELTQSDSTTYRHEVELSDLWLDGVWGGWREKNTGIRIGGDLRLTFPTSKFSQAVSRVLTVGPSANVSKTFKVLGGLTFVYTARFSWRFNRYSTRQNQGGQIVDLGACTPTRNIEGGFIDVCNNQNTGVTNVLFDVIHGPTVVFNPHERINLAASLFMQRGWVPGLPAVGELPATPMTTRDFIGFSIGVTYQPWDVVGFTLGAFTFNNQLGADGKYEVPFFNRNTVASLDATFDLEAVVSGITKEQK